MELNIDDFYKNENTRHYSDSIANSGNPNIGKDTWNNALKAPPLLKTPENITEAREVFSSWVSEWEKLPDAEIEALFIQHVASEIHEFEACDGWDDYKAQAENGQVSGNLFQHKNQVWIYLGN